MSQRIIPTPPSLSAGEFHETVLAAEPRIAVFDCDGTLWKGDAGFDFMVWSMGNGLLSPDRTAALNAQYRLYRAGEVSEVTICGSMVQVYMGLQESELRNAAEAFFRKEVAPQIFPEMERLVGALRDAGCELWAVSSTNNWVIEAGVARFGIAPERVLSARVRVEADGRITDDLMDVPTDEGKAEALRRAGVPAPDAVFGNSVHDAAMLALARRPFAVNPTPALLELAGTQGWPVFFPAMVREG